MLKVVLFFNDDWLREIQEVKEVTKKGVYIGLYNIDDKNDMIQFIEAGASGIITDYPQIMTEMGYCR